MFDACCFVHVSSGTTILQPFIRDNIPDFPFLSFERRHPSHRGRIKAIPTSDAEVLQYIYPVPL